ncbi:hypothetical protein CO046_02895 [Candidatus Peregrinibacteria bacterium CG_4_9_14_0_2_um_filter_53_11]|nr:MAG: hypothetical protein CO046_02895 [Candidatus Peregrinibacteria bacterium CG_4_9_14_0_2_um_filter_53_11]
MALLAAAAALAPTPSKAQSVPFSPDLTIDGEEGNFADEIRINPGAAPSSFTLDFNTNIEGHNADINEYQMALVSDPNAPSGLVIQVWGEKTVTPALSYPPIRIDRGDGQMRTVDFGVNESCFAAVDGQCVVDIDQGIMFRNVGRASSGNELIALTATGYPQWRDNPVRIPLDSNNWPASIEQQFADAQASGQNPFQAGVLDIVESSADDEFVMTEAGDLGVVQRRNLTTHAVTSQVLVRAPEGSPSRWQHLRDVGGGIWELEPSQTPYGVDDRSSIGGPSDMLERTTPDGRKVVLVVLNDVTAGGDDSDVRFIAFEKISGQGEAPRFRQLPMRIEEVFGELDSDGDGVVDSEDNAPGRANADQLDLNGDGIGDVAQANCEGNFPGQPLGEVLPGTDLRVCRSELGYNAAYSREDGSTFHVNADPDGDAELTVVNGVVMVKPGQEVFYAHSRRAGVDTEDTVASPNFAFPDDHSTEIKVHSVTDPDGNEGRVVVNGFDPFGEPVEVVFDGPSDWIALRDYNLTRGMVATLEGTAVSFRASAEANEQPVEDAGLPDAGSDELDAGVPDAAPVDPDAAPNPDAAQDPDAGLDAGVPDAAPVNPDAALPDAAPDPDAALPDPDAAQDPDATPPPPDATPAPDAAQPVEDAEAPAPDAAEQQVDAAAPLVDAAPVQPDMGLTCIPSEEVCDGVDNNCDGRIDEDLTEVVTNACGEFETVCRNGEMRPLSAVITPENERCNGIDDDCDGETDEGPLGGQLKIDARDECGNPIERVCMDGEFIPPTPMPCESDAAPDGAAVDAEVPSAVDAEVSTTKDGGVDTAVGDKEDTRIAEKKGGSGGGCSVMQAPEGDSNSSDAPLVFLALGGPLVALRRRNGQTQAEETDRV